MLNRHITVVAAIVGCAWALLRSAAAMAAAARSEHPTFGRRPCHW